MEEATVSQQADATIQGVLHDFDTVRQLTDSRLCVIFSLTRLTLALVLLWQAGRLVFQADLSDDLRRVDALFATGRYHHALAAAEALVARAPRSASALLRLGMVRAVRNEQPLASRALASALGLGLRGREHDLARLYQGRVSAGAGRHDEAAQVWATIGRRSPLFAVRRVLEAESLLAIGDYSDAEAAYRAVLLRPLPPEWRSVVHARLAGLRASSDPAGALAELAAIESSGAGVPPPDQALPGLDALIAPLLPVARPDPHQLGAALRAPGTQRAQLLGQLYLDAGWYALAEAQFASVAPNAPGALAAAAYAAYTRWQAGDREGGLRRLEALVAAHPDEPRARSLLALAYLSDNDAPGAQAQLDALRALAPRAPDTHLAWAQWYAARHDYLAAAEEYRRALADAPDDARGIYALAVARFHLDTTLQVCAAGWPAAETAAQLLPGDARAWTALAEARLLCGDPAGARAAAEQALLRDARSAEAAYYLGRALAALGDQAGARTALISAADLAPASAWRERAETQLATLGLSSSGLYQPLADHANSMLYW